MSPRILLVTLALPVTLGLELLVRAFPAASTGTRVAHGPPPPPKWLVIRPTAGRTVILARPIIARVAQLQQLGDSPR